jgi:hypothetical protein
MNFLNFPISDDYNASIQYSKKFKLKRIKHINVYLTYINAQNEIETISRNKLYIENKKNIISRNQLVDIIKNNQRKNNISYKLISIMVYNINVTPETLSDYIEKPEDFITLFTLSRIDSFELQSTISMLKEFNAMYFFFFEVPKPTLALTAPVASPPHTESREKGEKDEKGEKGEKVEKDEKEIQNKESTLSSTPKKPQNTTKRIYINEKSNNHNARRSNNRNNKTKRYDKYVNLL